MSRESSTDAGNMGRYGGDSTDAGKPSSVIEGGEIWGYLLTPISLKGVL